MKSQQTRELWLPLDLSLWILPVQPGAEWLCWVTDAVSRGNITSSLLLDVSSFLPLQIQAPERREGKGFDVVGIHTSLPPIPSLFFLGKSRSGQTFLGLQSVDKGPVSNCLFANPFYSGEESSTLCSEALWSALIFGWGFQSTLPQLSTTSHPRGSSDGF